MNEDKQPLNPADEDWTMQELGCFFWGGILTPFLVEDEKHFWSD